MVAICLHSERSWESSLQVYTVYTSTFPTVTDIRNRSSVENICNITALRGHQNHSELLVFDPRRVVESHVRFGISCTARCLSKHYSNCAASPYNSEDAD
jgi:hypothetical protein